ncbi:DUF2178 domain-containing protein, partial [Dysosmobacter welbionis]
SAKPFRYATFSVISITAAPFLYKQRCSHSQEQKGGIRFPPLPHLLLAAADILASAGVDLDLVARVDEQRHLHLSTGLQRRGLGHVGGGVAPQAGLGLRDLQVHEVGHFHGEHAALVAHQLADGVLLHEAEGVAQHVPVQ